MHFLMSRTSLNGLICAAVVVISFLVIPLNAQANESKTMKGSQGINLARVRDWSTQFPFLDLMKQSREWNDWDNHISGFIVDEHDWVTDLKPGQTAGTVFLTISSEQTKLFDEVTVLYEGEGEISYGWSASKDLSRSKPGRDVVSVGVGSNLIKISQVNNSNYLKNIRIVPSKYLTEFEGGATI